MSALEDLKKLRETVRKEVYVIKNLMAYIDPTQMAAGGANTYAAAMKAIDNLQRLAQTDSGNIGITVPTGKMGVKGQ